MPFEKTLNSLYRLTPSQVKSRVKAAFVISALTMFAACPKFFYQFRELVHRVSVEPASDLQIFKAALGQALILFAAALLSSLVGLLYADRLSLPGLGKFRNLKFWLPAALVIGLCLTPLSYYLADRKLMNQVPEMFPDAMHWAMAWIAGSALSQEVIARLGLFTIAVYFLRWFNFKGHPWPAILVVCLFTVMNFLILSYRFKLAGRIEPGLLHLSLASSFVFQWVMCEVYLRKGFLAAVALHAGLKIKLLLYAVLL
ncbi:MAG: hypothetical protein R6V10_15230 [bacterium]